MQLTNEQRKDLLARAAAVRARAHAPYSHYAVGAAVLTAAGHIHVGVNVENASYPNGSCAEPVAIYTAVTQGERQFVAIAISTANGGMPCGQCRQIMAEFSLDMLVLICDGQANLLQETTVRDLLPGAFGASHLPT